MAAAMNSANGQYATPSGAKDLCSNGAIDSLLNTITIQFGPQIMLAAKIRMKPGLTIDDAVAHINELEAQIKQRHPEVGWCFVEPDVAD